MAGQKILYAEFANFFEQPTRATLTDLLQKHMGESANCDFKSNWMAFCKLAKHILAFGNSGGGCLVIGVNEQDDGTFSALGIETVIDKADFYKSIDKYIPDHLCQQVEILDFAFNANANQELAGKKFQVVFLPDLPQYVPFLALADGEGLRKNTVYVRKGTNSTEATHEDLQSLLNRRLETGHSSRPEIDLERHLDQLQVLYRHIKKTNVTREMPFFMRPFAETFAERLGLRTESTPNPKYPSEDFEEFIARMIRCKKQRIERELDLVV